jgi:hypothetical protein
MGFFSPLFPVASRRFIKGEYDDSIVRGQCFATATFVVLLASFSQAAYAGPNWDCWADHNLVKPDQTTYLADTTINMRFETSNQIVEINGIRNETFFASWTMQLVNRTPGEDIIDHDIAGQNVSTNANAHWEHLAKGSGVLAGNRTLGTGVYQAFVKTRIDATRAADQSTKFHNYELTKDYNITAG